MKKKLINLFLFERRKGKKLFLVMKLSLFLILISLFSVSASVYSQSVSINMKLHEASLEKVFQEIQDQTEFDIFYKNEQLPRNKIIDAVYTKDPSKYKKCSGRMLCI